MTLYKYVVPARIDVLQWERIRFTQPSALNDPFELKPYFEDLVPEDQFDEQLQPSWEQLEEALREQHGQLPPEQRSFLSADQMVALVRDNPEIMGQTLHNLRPMFRQLVTDFVPKIREMLWEGFAEKVGILSLSEAPDDVLMWAHYADNHRGFLIGFDENNSFFNRRRSEKDDFYHLRPVMYAARDDRKAMSELTGLEVFLTKDPWWAYEREWRMIVPLADPVELLIVGGDRIALFAFPPSAVTSVVVGGRARPDLVRELESIPNNPRYRHVAVVKAVLNDKDRTVIVQTGDAS